MRIVYSLDDCTFRESDQVVAALGFFDGLHLAHRQIIDQCISRAKTRNGTSLLFTFQNHPSTFLNPDQNNRLLTPLRIKLQCLEKMGVDVVVCIPFDAVIRNMSAQEFITGILRARLCALEIVVGFNFFFGKNREGTAQRLQQSVPEYFKNVVVVESISDQSSLISSTWLRQKIVEGKLDDAARMLQRPYQIGGTVIRGAGRGRQWGIPTANLNSSGQILPPNGVYGVYVHIDSIDAPPIAGVMNIGVNPTFSDAEERSVEVHLLDFQQDLYDQYLIVDVLQFLREERKFASPESLIQQIRQDIDTFQNWIKQPD